MVWFVLPPSNTFPGLFFLVLMATIFPCMRPSSQILVAVHRIFLPSSPWPVTEPPKAEVLARIDIGIGGLNERWGSDGVGPSFGTASGHQGEAR
jgi:hypothetical protein